MTRSPRVIITATDLVRAKPFAFTREQLNGVCVDPKSVPVARAVFASAATPIYFAPLVMRSFAGHCGYQPPDSVEPPTRWSEEDVYRRERAERLLSFLDSTNYPYLHLADGAFADNLGARAILDEVALGETVTDALRRNGYSRARRMLFIVVDARTGFDPKYAQAPEPLGIKKVMDAVVSVTFNRYSFETMNLHARAREALGDRGAQHALQGRAGDSRLRQVRRRPGGAVASSASRTRRSANTWIAFRRRSRCRTEQIIRLRRAAHLLVEESPELRDFLEESARSAPTQRRSRRAPTTPSVIFPMQSRERLRDARAMQPIRRILVAVKNPAARALPAVNKAAQIAKGLARSSRCFTTSRRRCTRRRCRVARSTSSPGSAKCRPRGASSSKSSPRASASTASTSMWRPTGTSRPTKPSSARRNASRPICWSSRIITARGTPPGALAAGLHGLGTAAPVPDSGAAGQEPAAVSPAARARGHRSFTCATPSPSNLDRQILRAGAQLVHALHGELHALHALLPGAAGGARHAGRTADRRRRRARADSNASRAASSRARSMAST